jgi:hypothetical protein
MIIPPYKKPNATDLTTALQLTFWAVLISFC